jgi:hypothetical protein
MLSTKLSLANSLVLLLILLLCGVKLLQDGIRLRVSEDGASSPHRGRVISWIADHSSPMLARRASIGLGASLIVLSLVVLAAWVAHNV